MRVWTLALAWVTLSAQTVDAPVAARLLGSFGEDSFSLQYRRALNHYFAAESAYRAGDYSRAKQALDSFWLRHPPGTAEWSAGIEEARAVARRTGLNFGTPVCYYAMRMLTDCVEWRLKGSPPARYATIRLTVVVAGHSRGPQPQTLDQLHRGVGPEIRHIVDPRLAANGYAPVSESLWLFGEYVRAMTAGKLVVEARVLSLPDLDVAMFVKEKPSITGELTAAGYRQICDAIPAAVKAETDWWWFLYPAHAPENLPAFDGMDLGGGGGMSVGPDGSSPAFMIDDLWLLRKPRALGRGPYTSEERRAYLPQWLQHEFFHHLYRTWPEFHLEGPNLHDWFDRRTWPADFQGLLEPDYYWESLHKRLQPLANPPLHVKLRYRPPPPELFARLTPEQIAGAYRREPVENAWHEGVIAAAPLRWKNGAGIGWSLDWRPAGGRLDTGPDNPYYSNSTGRFFQIELRRGPDGEWLPAIEGFRFNGELYRRR